MEVGELIFIGFCSLAAINALFFTGYLLKDYKVNIDFIVATWKECANAHFIGLS